MRCSNDAILAKIVQRKLEEQDEISFSVRRKLPDCRKINAKNVISGTVSYNRYKKPVNRFECLPDGCSTTGTVTVAADQTPVWYVESDATEFAAGVITAYVIPDSYPATLSLTISDSSNFTNSDVYTMTLTADMAAEDGFVPVAFDLSQAPASTTGTGWSASAEGAYIKFGATASDTAIAFQISSISVLDSIDDFETNATVKVACISSAGGSYDLSTIDRACADAEIDDTISQLSFPITAKLITPNHYLLSPMYQKGKETEGFRLATVKKTVEAYTYNGQAYGRVFLTDAHETECRFWAVQFADSCDPFESQLSELSLPTIMKIDEGHFQVVRTNGDPQVIFNSALVGKEVIISYPQKAEIEEIIMGTDELNGVETSMTVPYQFGAVKELHIYDNVLVTGFPFSIANSDQEISFSITITKENGRFFRIQRFV